MASQVAKNNSVKSDIERELEHDLLDKPKDDDMLATMSDRQEHRFQMQEIKRRTERPGVMKLDVDNIETAENSQQWAIDLAHPARPDGDTIRIFAKKPMSGWSHDYKIVRLLDWYSISSQDPHQLEFHDIYVEKNDAESERSHGWQVTEPPEYTPNLIRYAKRLWYDVARDIRPERDIVKMWIAMLLGTVGVGTGVLSGYVGVALIPTLYTLVGSFLIATIVGLVVMPHE